MESVHGNGYSGDLRTGPGSNLGEGEQFNSGNKTAPSSSSPTSGLSAQDHFLLPTNENTKTDPDTTSPPSHDQGYSQPAFHLTLSLTEQGDGSITNSHEGTHAANYLGEAHTSTVGNQSASPFSSSLNPFHLPSDQTNLTPEGATLPENVHDQGPSKLELYQPFSVMQEGNEGMIYSNLTTYPGGTLGETHHSSTSDLFGCHSSSTPSVYESSSGNPFEVPANTNSKGPDGIVSQNVNENHDYGHQLYHTLPAMEDGHGSMTNSEVITHPDNTPGETHFSSSSQQSGSSPVLSSSAFESSQNQSLTDATGETHEGAIVTPKVEARNPFSIIEQGHECMAGSNVRADPVVILGEAGASDPDSKLGSSLPSFSQTSESSSREPIHISVDAAGKSQTNTDVPPKPGLDSQLASECSDDDIPISSMPKHGQASESSSREPIHISVDAAGNSQTNTDVPPKLGLDSQIASECSDDDIPISSMPKHGQSSDVAGQNSQAVAPGQNPEFDTNNGLEIQNPPVQVMERPGDSSPSIYRIPSHVFARNNTNAPEWSTASNESLFSIHTGNMSFSRELAWINKSGELDKYDMNLSGPLNAYPSDPPPPNKLNDISQRTADQHESSGVTEAKAAETMREVIKENTGKFSQRDLSFADRGASRNDRLSSDHHHSHQSHQSDGSTKSFAFQVFTDGDKSVSSRVSEEKPKQQNHPEPPTPKETPNMAAQSPMSTTNAPAARNRWLSCFACCTFCH